MIRRAYTTCDNTMSCSYIIHTTAGEYINIGQQQLEYKRLQALKFAEEVNNFEDGQDVIPSTSSTVFQIDQQHNTRLQAGQSTVRSLVNGNGANDRAHITNVASGHHQMDPQHMDTPVQLRVGSRIQLPSSDSTMKYGVIKWIGFVTRVQGEVAGIELVRI